MKALHLTSYFDECFFGFVFWRRFLSLASYFDEGFFLSLKNEGFTSDFVFWRRLLTLASYFDEGFTLWLRIVMKVSFLLWKMKASHLTSYFDEGLFGFVFWWRLLWLHILTKVSHFDFIFWWRFNYFSFFLWTMKASHSIVISRVSDSCLD
jgi:hypothetical protein